MVALKEAVDSRKVVEEEVRKGECERHSLVALENFLDEKVRAQKPFNRSFVGMVSNGNYLGNLIPAIFFAFGDLGAGIEKMEEGYETLRPEVSEVLRRTASILGLIQHIRDR